jgi:F-type H+-transporting ATPase subunit a
MATPAGGSEEQVGKKEKFDASSFILHHIADSHEWHLFGEGEHSVAIYLPVILYDKESGFHLFSSRKISHGHVHNGFRIEEGRIVKVDAAGNINKDYSPLDLSMTKTVVAMLSAALIGLILFLSLARSYKKTGISSPKGIQGFLERLSSLYATTSPGQTSGTRQTNTCHTCSRYSPSSSSTT